MRYRKPESLSAKSGILPKSPRRGFGGVGNNVPNGFDFDLDFDLKNQPKMGDFPLLDTLGINAEKKNWLFYSSNY